MSLNLSDPDAGLHALASQWLNAAAVFGTSADPELRGQAKQAGECARQLAALLATREQEDRLRRAVDDWLDAKRRYRESPYAADPRCVGALFIKGQIERAEGDIEAAFLRPAQPEDH